MYGYPYLGYGKIHVCVDLFIAPNLCAILIVHRKYCGVSAIYISNIQHEWYSFKLKCLVARLCAFRHLPRRIFDFLCVGYTIQQSQNKDNDSIHVLYHFLPKGIKLKTNVSSV